MPVKPMTDKLIAEMKENTTTRWIVGPFGCIWNGDHVECVEGKWVEKVPEPQIIFSGGKAEDIDLAVKAVNSYHRIATLEAENALLRKALAPFANYISKKSLTSNEFIITAGDPRARGQLTAGHCRHARAVLDIGHE